VDIINFWQVELKFVQKSDNVQTSVLCFYVVVHSVRFEWSSQLTIHLKNCLAQWYLLNTTNNTLVYSLATSKSNPYVSVVHFIVKVLKVSKILCMNVSKTILNTVLLDLEKLILHLHCLLPLVSKYKLFLYFWAQFCSVVSAVAEKKNDTFWQTIVIIFLFTKVLIFIARQHTNAWYWYSNSVCLSVCLSIHDLSVSDENGLTYCHSFFTIR